MIGKIDILIIVVYLLLIISIGFISRNGNKTQDDFLLANRQMPWLPIAFSIAATMISANTFIGAPGWAYNQSMAPFMTNIMVPMAVFIALSITIPIFYHMKVTSIYEYIDLRFGTYTKILTLLQFFINSIIQVSSMVFIPSLIIQKMTGLDFYLIVPLVMGVSIIYTLVGGIKAVIWTDFSQMLIVWGSALLILYFALSSMNISLFDSITKAKELGKFDIFNFDFKFDSPTGFYASTIGGFFLWTRYFCFDQVQVQRILTAKSIESTKQSLCLSAILMNTIFFIMLFIGIILFQFYNGRTFESSNDVMITFILENLPVGILGLAIAGALASAMSSVDSLLNSITTVFIKDIYEKNIKKNDQETPLKTTMLIATIFGIIIIIFVLLGFSNSVESVVEVVGNYISYFSGPACGIFLLGMFTKSANDKGSAIGAIIGFILTIAISIRFDTAWTINPAIGTILTIGIGYFTSLIITSQSNVKYCASEIRQNQMIFNSEKISKSELPFTIDKYSVITLLFFVLQFVLIYIIK